MTCSIIVGQSESASFCRLQERASLLFVGIGDEDLDGPETVERQPVRVSKRFAALDRRNAGSFEKPANLLRVDLTVGDKDSTQVLIHGAL
jgi:hypothetical protein